MIEAAKPDSQLALDSRDTARTARKRAQENSASQDRLALNAVYEIAKTFTSAPDPISVMPMVLNVLSSFLGLRHGALALLSEPNRPITTGTVNPYVIAATSFNCPEDTPNCEVIPDVVAQMVFRTGVPLVSWDLEREFGPEAMPLRLRGTGHSLIAVPVREQVRSPLVIGVLCAFRAHDDDRAGQSNSDINVLTMVASLLEQALRFRRLVARDRERALNDTRRALSAATEQLGRTPKPVTIDGIIGDSDEIGAVVARIRKVATTTAPVLLRGESGTGKELFARAIHALSDRKDKPFIRVNCAALSETLLESELFGHEKGAFTGANALKKGRFELAHGGTLFLDEIGEISPAFQSKLLRVLQEGEFERVGGTRTMKVDVRLVTATNRDLEEAVAQGAFRADLYFRICVVPIILPPLRERPSDIRPLAELFLDRFNDQNGTSLAFAPDAFETLCNCKFPGNVRELENCVNRAAALSTGEVILNEEMACNQNACLSAELWRLQSGDTSPIGGLSAGHTITPTVMRSQSKPPESHPVTPAPQAPHRKTANTARDELIAAMEEAGWVQAKAARLLNMTPRQIAYALKKHNIELRRI
ncbi:MAG: nif-specific transcriptional activator NifA [Rhodobacteraceae bacterium]|nr:nif-specific transcriptional activator NifA [Paracoccaceae bacterium]MAY44687.1 nif-specific transcriptional activator NifA [Paracoccaceae bacterium]